MQDMVKECGDLRKLEHDLTLSATEQPEAPNSRP